MHCIIIYLQNIVLWPMAFIEKKASILENTHNVSILLILLEEGSMTKGILGSKLTRNYESIRKRLDQLKEAGIVKIYESGEHPRPHHVELTPLGIAIAEKLEEIEKLLEAK